MRTFIPELSEYSIKTEPSHETKQASSSHDSLKHHLQKRESSTSDTFFHFDTLIRENSLRCSQYATYSGKAVDGTIDQDACSGNA